MQLGERIKSCRKRMGLSLRALAEQVGVSAQAISKYERNEDVPTSRTLIRLSKALQVSVEYLLRPTTVHLSEPAYRHHRSKVSHAKKEILCAQVQDWIERYLTLEHLLGELHEFTIPNISRKMQSPEDVEQVAIDLRHHWDLGLNALPNLIETLEERGIKVGLLPAVDHVDALSLVANDTLPVIVVRDNLPGDRQRFSIAHELAHLILEMPKEWSERQIEQTANRFAGAFLVPKPVVQEELGFQRRSLSLGELYALKHKYGISMQAWIYRAQEVGIISSEVVKRLFQLFRGRNWYRTEPGTPYPAETSTRMERLALRALNDGTISETRACELLGKPLIKFTEDFLDQHEPIALCD